MGETRSETLRALLFQSPNLSKRALIGQIRDAYQSYFALHADYEKNRALLEEAIEWLDDAYGSSLRKDGKTPSICHALSIARDIAVCGGDANYILLALFHDAGEDFAPQVLGELKKRFNVAIGEHSLIDLVRKLTYDHIMRYEEYLNGLYSDWGREIGLMLTLIKAFDGLENAKTIFPGMEEQDLNRHIEKAMLCCRIWKKLNKDVYSYMLSLLGSKGADVEKFSKTSHNQASAHQSGVRVVREREVVNGDFIQSLPDEGSNVIIIYEPQAVDLYMKSKVPDCITVEYSSAFLQQAVFKSVLLRHFPNAIIAEKQSLLPRLLRNKSAYFYQITSDSGFDAQKNMAFFRHLHKLSMFYPNWFLGSQSLLHAALVSYGWLWERIFYRREDAIPGYFART